MIQDLSEGHIEVVRPAREYNTHASRTKLFRLSENFQRTGV